VRLRQSIFFIGGCAAVIGLLYALWYQLGPESAKPDLAEMRKYRLSKLTDDDLKLIVQKAKKDAAGAVLREREMRTKAWEEHEAQVRAWETASAQCNEPAFKLRNEELCAGPPSAGMGMLWGQPMMEVPSEAEYIERYIMESCMLFATTVREARKLNCLPPK